MTFRVFKSFQIDFENKSSSRCHFLCEVCSETRFLWDNAPRYMIFQKTMISICDFFEIDMRLYVFMFCIFYFLGYKIKLAQFSSILFKLTSTNLS